MSLKDTKFGAYTIVRQLSAGDTSEVYLAKREGFAGFARQVVIKCVPKHISKDSKFIEQFRDEAQLVARLNHPNIVPVHEFGQEGETHYLMMEYIPGISLEEAITKTFGIEPSHVLRIASEMCSGLYYAHTLKDDMGQELGIVHRNLNPQNVLLGLDGSVKLIDFGIARAAKLSQETRTALFKGKYGYLSPEQANGEAVDYRTDIHAVGVVVWEMLMGFPLYDRGNAVDTVEAVLHEKPSPVVRRHPDLSKKIDEILGKALAKTPDDRFQSAGDFQEVIEEFVAASGQLSTTTALGKFVRSCAEPETTSPEEQADKESDIVSFGTSKTALERPGKGKEDQLPKASESSTTKELIKPRAKRSEEPYFLTPPTGPPPTVRVAPINPAAPLSGSDEPERMDPTIPMWGQGPHQGSGVGAHLARLAAAQTPDDIEAPPQTPSFTRQPEGRRSVALWIFSSTIGIALVAAVTFFVMRGDLFERWTSRLFDDSGAIPSTRHDASPRPTDATPTKEASPEVVTDEPDADMQRAKTEAGLATGTFPSAFLSLRSEPSGAQLFLDGNSTREWTAFRDLPIDPGEHTIELVLIGYRRWRKNVVVEEGQRLTLRANLHVRPEDETDESQDAGALPDFGILTVNTTPPSLVYIGRKSLGETPVSDVEIPTGEHQLTFVFKRGPRIRRSVRILSGRTTRRNFDFTSTLSPEKAPTTQKRPPTKQESSPTKEQPTTQEQGSSPTKEQPLEQPQKSNEKESPPPARDGAKTSEATK